ncbi:WD40/YVTN/BNR-like repeat-containing protein [Actinophytocola oryzae]|uniref:Photosystem II stability/assembly factor-like uncharacterized protein n=1 Tax=Actinophytocola oryzae TaxID=502181 RepID=A0A4R7UWN2_9PSEU|nr:oxidoreductase [Actinophytocola oryzae]TDV40477.1 photosystem II stability/assembly factor-like uncharacterized protein [Actinophytocola oryzae]
MKRALMISLLVLATFLTAPAGANATSLTWAPTTTGSDARLRGLSAVDRYVAWASGSAGTILRTVDGGRHWQQVAPPGTESLDFRDIEAFDARTAIALSIGEADASRIYRTTDGGRTWTETFRNAEPTAFYNCLAFFDSHHGLTVGDPVDGEFRVLSTEDGGRSWKNVPGPAALAGEYQFSASGQCLNVAGRRDAWLATGGSTVARVLHSSDRGLTWTASQTPLASSESAGVFAVAFRDPRTGIAIGGDFDNPTNGADALALSGNGGRTWRAPATAPAGYRSGVTYHPFLADVLIAVGPTGSDASFDGGRHWRQFYAGSLDTVDCGRDGACWAAGATGAVATLRLG